MPRPASSSALPIPAQRSRRGRAVVPDAPLGSLTQRTDRKPSGCPSCGTSRVTTLEMTLTDGTPVVFVSCHRCEHRRWEHEGSPLSVESVLERTRKPA